MKQENSQSPKALASRRGMLFGAAAAGSAAVAVTALPKMTATESVAAVVPKVMPANGGGYHASEHVKRYYSTTLI